MITKRARLAAERDDAALSATTGQMLSEAREDVQRADQKASVLLATLGIGFAVVTAGQFAGNFDLSKFSTCGQIIWWVGVVVATLSVALSALALWPRYRLNDRPEFGITYWGHIAAFKTLDDFDAALTAEGNPTNRRGRHQVWRLSKLVLAKYRSLRAAIVSGGAAGLLLALASIIVR